MRELVVLSLILSAATSCFIEPEPSGPGLLYECRVVASCGGQPILDWEVRVCAASQADATMTVDDQPDPLWRCVDPGWETSIWCRVIYPAVNCWID